MALLEQSKMMSVMQGPNCRFVRNEEQEIVNLESQACCGDDARSKHSTGKEQHKVTHARA